jgi:hypothetical protein
MPETAPTIKIQKPPGGGPPPVAFGVNEMRLTLPQWMAAAAILIVVISLTPRLWPAVERFDTGPDYRIPYQLSSDYWLFARRLAKVEPGKTFLVGDSFVWGEYVQPDGTLSHFLNAPSREERYVNAGVNGMFPLALEGLIRYYGGRLHDRKVLLQCNLLWMTSPKADLSARKPDSFNHSRLVPQFFPRIPCYQADANERLCCVIERNVPFLSWVDHLQDCYFQQQSIPAWTLQTGGAGHDNPFAQITFRVPSAQPDAAERGPESPRHKAWFANGSQTVRFDWVPLERSLQWAAFQRLVGVLRERGNDVLVVVGPFNEHMVAEASRDGYRRDRDGVVAWLRENRIAHVEPELLPSEYYADASHPITQGYELLAKRLVEDPAFKDWEKTAR